jgi:GT2 family glycosyltransferase
MSVIVISPVKDALAATLQTVEAIVKSDQKIDYRIYNDYSSKETEEALVAASGKYGFRLFHLRDLTPTPSPNYKTVLQHAQKAALDAHTPLIIIESDVTVKEDTISKLLDFAQSRPKCGLIGAITVDEKGDVNFPYLKFKNEKRNVIPTKRSLSFCCTLITRDFLEAYSFASLDESKDWFDTHISKKAVELGFENYVLTDVMVTHQPHGSRPWKMLKYTNPIRYYLNKFFKGRDKI